MTPFPKVKRDNQFAEGLFRERLDAVILFGSHARGDYDTESDIDIMIPVDMDALALAPFKYQFARFGTDLDTQNIIACVCERTFYEGGACVFQIHPQERSAL